MPLTPESENFIPETTPEEGPGSQTPLDPSANTPVPPGEVKPDAPKGAPGNFSGSGSSPLGDKGDPKDLSLKEKMSPDDIEEIKNIYEVFFPAFITAAATVLDNEIKDLPGFIDSLDKRLFNEIKDVLLESGWDENHLINDILPSVKMEDIKKFLRAVNDNKEKLNELRYDMHDEYIQEKLQNFSSGKESKYNSNRSEIIMGDSLRVQSGSVVKSSSTNPSVSDNLFYAIKKAKKSLKEAKQQKLMIKGAEAIGTDFGDAGVSENSFKASVDTLTEALKGLMEALKAADVEKEDTMDKDLDKELGELIDDGSDVMDSGSSFLGEESEPKESAFNFESKDEKKEDEEKKEDDKKPFDSDKKDEDNKDGDDKKDDKEEDKKEDKDENKGNPFSKESSNKSAQEYPFKDVNKVKHEDKGGDYAKQQSSTIETELNKGPRKDKNKGFLGQNREKGEGDCAPIKDPDPKQIGKKSAKRIAENAAAKSRFAVELASQQQLKDMLPNPLKETLISEFVKVGFNKEVVDAVIHNAFVDSYEQAQQIVIKEAFENFISEPMERIAMINKLTKTHNPEGLNSNVEE